MNATGRSLPRVISAVLVSGSALLAASATEEGKAIPAHRAESVPVGHVRLRVVRAGHGTPVLLLHGFGESLLSWQMLFDELARRAQVVAVDLPGFGLSSKPPSGYGADSLATIALGLMDELGVRRAILVGHSLGGAVAAATAVLRPDRVLGLVLLDPALVTPWNLREVGTPNSTGDIARRLIAAYEQLRTRFGGVHDPEWLAEDSTSAAYQPAGDPAYAQALAAVLREFDFTYLTRQRSLRLTMPVLLIWGAQDPVVPVSAARSLVTALPNARLEILSRTWHRPQVERPGDVARLILAFVAAAEHRMSGTAP